MFGAEGRLKADLSKFTSSTTRYRLVNMKRVKHT